MRTIDARLKKLEDKLAITPDIEQEGSLLSQLTNSELQSYLNSNELPEDIALHRKQVVSQTSIYIPTNRKDERIIERFIELGTARERSVNFLCLKALTEYLERQAVA